MRRNCVLTDTMYGPIHIIHLTLQIKSTTSKASAKPQLLPSDDSLTIPPLTKNHYSFYSSSIGAQQNGDFNPKRQIHRDSESTCVNSM